MKYYFLFVCTSLDRQFNQIIELVDAHNKIVITIKFYHSSSLVSLMKKAFEFSSFNRYI